MDLTLGVRRVAAHGMTQAKPFRGALAEGIEINCDSPMAEGVLRTNSSMVQDSSGEGGEMDDWHSFTSDSESFSTANDWEQHLLTGSSAYQTLQHCFQLKAKDYTDIESTPSIFSQNR